MTVQCFLQDCQNHQNLRAETWPSDTSMREKIYGPVEPVAYGGVCPSYRSSCLSERRRRRVDSIITFIILLILCVVCVFPCQQPWSWTGSGQPLSFPSNHHSDFFCFVFWSDPVTSLLTLFMKADYQDVTDCRLCRDNKSSFNFV